MRLLLKTSYIWYRLKDFLSSFSSKLFNSSRCFVNLVGGVMLNGVIFGVSSLNLTTYQTDTTLFYCNLSNTF